MKAYRELPEGYTLHEHIDLEKDKKRAIWLNVMTIALFLGVFAFLPVIGIDISVTLPGIFFLFVGIVLYIVAHEIIHGIFFRLDRNLKVRYQFHGFAASAAAPDAYLTKPHFLIVGLAPFFVLTAVFALILPLTSGGVFVLFYCLFALHISGCAGDFYVTYKLMRMPKSTLVEDYGIGMRFFTPEDSGTDAGS